MCAYFPLLVLLSCFFLPFSAKAQSVSVLLQQGIEALGGEVRLLHLESLHLTGQGRQHMVDQAEYEGDEGPHLYFDLAEWYDFVHTRLHRTWQVQFTADLKFERSWIYEKDQTFEVFQGNVRPGRPVGATWLDLMPYRVLSLAQEADDVRQEAPEWLHGILHKHLSFSWQGTRVHLHFHPTTYLLQAISWQAPYFSDYFDVMGDIANRVVYRNWFVTKSGLSVPTVIQQQRNGETVLSVTVQDIAVNQPIPDSLFAVPDTIRTAFETQWKDPIATLNANFGPLGTQMEVAPGIVYFSGQQAINPTLVEQEDGIIVLEAPITSQHSEQVIAAAEALFPGKPIKAVVVSASTRIYLSGVRTYVRRGIPLYIHPAHQAMLDALVSAPFNTYPDELAHAPRHPIYQLVTQETSLGAGPNRLILTPAPTTTPRLMAYFPQHRVLYAADLYARNLSRLAQRNGRLSRTLYEWQKGIEAKNYPIARIFSLHMPPMLWQAYQDMLRSAFQ